jgi:hypothetical protein
MVPVINAIAPASNAMETELWSDSGHAQRIEAIGTVEKLLFNIGRIPVRQSRQPAWGQPCLERRTANLAAGQKRVACGALPRRRINAARY